MRTVVVIGMHGRIGCEPRMNCNHHVIRLPLGYSQTGNRRVLLWLHSVVLTQQQIDLTVEHARLDQGADADLQKAGQAMIHLSNLLPLGFETVFELGYPMPGNQPFTVRNFGRLSLSKCVYFI